jgi:TPR repeat protein
MFETLEEIYSEFEYNVKTINENKYLTDYILDLYNNKNIETICSDMNKLFWNGNYYKNIKNYDEMKKYYLMSIELGHSGSMNNLGYYYKNIKNYDEMKKYYLMAVELGQRNSMYNLGNYYQSIEKNYDEIKKYYLMAVELGHCDSMYNLGYYYQSIEKNYDEMKKYYLMAVELGNINSVNNLVNYYKNIEKNYDEMKKCYLMAIDLNNENVIMMCKQNNYFYDDNIKNKILHKTFKIIEEEIYCSITLEKTNKCFITKCNHKFSDEILKCSLYPLCRTKIQ